MRINTFLLLVVAAAVMCSIAEARSPRGQHIRQRRAMFNLIDTDRNGVASFDEVEKYLRDFDDEYSDKHMFMYLDSYDGDGNGEISWEEYRDRYFKSKDLEEPMPTLFDDYEPQGIHIALTSKPDEMRIMWFTRNAANASIVQWGTTSGSYPNSAPTVLTTYTEGYIVGWHGWVYTATLTGLAPATRFYYRVGDPSIQMSDEWSFKTDSTVPSTTRVAIWGDMGTAMPLGFEVADLMKKDHAAEPFDILVHVGDLSYAGTSENEYEFIWDDYQNQMEELAATAPYMTTVGNHERYYNYTAFNTRYEMPGDEQQGVRNLWFSYDYGYAHYVSMSTEHNYAPGSPQYQWLVADLTAANANRAVRPWIIFLGHRPMYSSDLQTDSGPLQEYLEQVLVEQRVDIGVWGHMHCYERIYPVNNNTVTNTNYVDAPSPAHLVVGMAGAFIHEKYQDPSPAWSATRDSQYGYEVMEVEYDRITFSFVKLNQDDSSPGDSFVMIHTDKWWEQQ